MSLNAASESNAVSELTATIAPQIVLNRNVRIDEDGLIIFDPKSFQFEADRM